MDNIKIGVIVGSLRKGSINARLATALSSLAPEGVAFQRIGIDKLPFYNGDEENTPNTAVERLRNEVRAMDGIIFVTPEYNRSIPGVLKNAIDHGSRPYGKSVWSGKLAAVIGASPGAIGTAMAQQHLRNILAYLDMPTLGQPEAFIQVDGEFFDAGGTVVRQTNRDFLQKWVSQYVTWVATQKSIGAA